MGSSPPSPTTRKRSLENTDTSTSSDIEYSNFFKMRDICKHLRPHFIQLLRTPDFQNSQAAIEIQQKLNVMMDLYEEMTTNTNTLKKCKNIPQTPPLSDEDHEGARSDPSSMEPPEDKSVLSGNMQGTYVVGGSAFGWNFITFLSTKLIYYGRTKEAFRLQNPVSK